MNFLLRTPRLAKDPILEEIRQKDVKVYTLASLQEEEKLYLVHVDYICKYTDKANNSTYELQPQPSVVEEEDEMDEVEVEPPQQEEIGPYFVSSPNFSDEPQSGDEY